jgi:folate-binding protein YgfZ
MQAFSSNPGTVIRFSGEDQAEFLQGQGTADLMRPAGSSTYSLWLDFKGNILGDGFVLRLGPEESLLISYTSDATALMAKFDRHIIADDVELENLTGRYRLHSIPAGSVPEAITEGGWEAPGEGMFSEVPKGFLFAGSRLGPGTLEVLMEKDEADSLPVTEIPSDEAERLRIVAGVLLIPQDTGVGEFNPIETGLVSAVDFGKGCYLGQEVVARCWQARNCRLTARLSGQLHL